MDLTQAMVDAVPAGGTLRLDAGTYVPQSDPIRRDSPLHVVGAGVGETVIDHRAGTGHLFDFFELRGGDISMSDVCALGVDTPSQTPGVIAPALLAWVRAKTYGSVRLERVWVTGKYDSVVNKAGAGLVAVKDCILNAYEAPVKHFASHGEPGGHLSVTDSHLTGHDSKVSSIGLYVHPNISAAVTGCHFDNFGRYGFYHNGNPPAQGATVSISDCTFHDCDVIRAAKQTHPTLIRCTSTGNSNSGGTLIEHNLTAVDCRFASRSVFTMTHEPHALRFVGCHFEPHNHALMLSGPGTVEFVNCEWDLNPRGEGDTSNARMIRTTATSAARIDLFGNTIRDHHGDNFLIGGRDANLLRWAHTDAYTSMADPFRAVNQLGAPTIHA